MIHAAGIEGCKTNEIARVQKNTKKSQFQFTGPRSYKQNGKNLESHHQKSLPCLLVLPNHVTSISKFCLAQHRNLQIISISSPHRQKDSEKSRKHREIDGVPVTI